MIDLIIGVILIVVAYLLGSVPFGLLLSKYVGIGDIRQMGSGNIGATNVLRVGNKKVAVATLLLDMAKGMIAVVLAKNFGGQWVALLSAVAAVLGHIFPVWLGYKGGKGVATAMAVYLVLYWPLGVFASVVWLMTFAVARISSLSSIAAVFLSPVFALFFGGWGMFFCVTLIGGVVIFRHLENIMRLLRGQEKSFGKG